MQLSSLLSQFFQKETDQLLKDFLDNNPDIRKKYVNGGLTAVGTVLHSVNYVMRHLLTVQGLDPDAEPGAAQRALIQQVMSELFNNVHEKSFDDDYDFSWVKQKFENIRGKLKDPDMSQEKFMELTDLSRLEDKPEDVSKEKFANLAQRLNPVADEAEKREAPFADLADVRPVLENLAKAAHAAEHGAVFDPGDAIEKLKEFAERLKSKDGLKTGQKKLNKRTSKTNKISRNEQLLKIKEKLLEDKENLLEDFDDLHGDRAVALVRKMVKNGLVKDSVELIESTTRNLLKLSSEKLSALEKVVNRHDDSLKKSKKFTGSFTKTRR